MGIISKSNKPSNPSEEWEDESEVIGSSLGLIR